MCILMRPYESGRVALVDADDFWDLADYDWYVTAGGYAFRNTSTDKTINRPVYMHRQILQTPIGFETDHVNGDKLDNRRANLRVCTRQQNTWNRRKLSTRETLSPYKGVWVDGFAWIAQITVDGQLVKSEHFAVEEEAARAYDDLARKHFGAFARLNFPHDGEQAA